MVNARNLVAEIGVHRIARAGNRPELGRTAQYIRNAVFQRFDFVLQRTHIESDTIRKVLADGVGPSQRKLHALVEYSAPIARNHIRGGRYGNRDYGITGHTVEVVEIQTQAVPEHAQFKSDVDLLNGLP